MMASRASVDATGFALLTSEGRMASSKTVKTQSGTRHETETVADGQRLEFGTLVQSVLARTFRTASSAFVLFLTAVVIRRCLIRSRLLSLAAEALLLLSSNALPRYVVLVRCCSRTKPNANFVQVSGHPTVSLGLVPSESVLVAQLQTDSVDFVDIPPLADGTEIVQMNPNSCRKAARMTLIRPQVS